ncbi:MAG: hypothetical protein JWO14_3312 [Solirubrobacterales bacterium]|nr:hypothetical protein [Solirubrobacterales bacterium]
MPKIGSSRVSRLAVLLCGALAVGSASSNVSAADAGPLETLPGQVREATKVVEEVAKSVAPTVQEVTEAVPPPVTEVTETVTPPVVETTEAVVPPPKEAVETVTKATQEVTAKVPSLPTTAPPRTPATPATESSSGTKAVNQAAQTLTHDVEGAVGEVTGTAGSGRSSAAPHTARVTNPSSGDAAVAAAGSTGGAPAAAEAPGASPRTDAAAGATTMRTTGRDGLRDDKFATPSSDGSIRAPLPKWMAYVWPAIALAWPELAVFLDRWEWDGASLLLASEGAGGPSGSHGVAGVHASHDALSDASASGSSSSPFAPIPAAIGGFTSHVPGEALAYLAIVGILVVAVFVAVKLELAHRGRGSS